MSSIRRYLQFVKPYRMQIIGTIIIGFIKFSIPLIIPMLIKYVVDDIINNRSLEVHAKINRLMWMLGVMIIIFVVLRPPIEYITGNILPSGLQVRFYMISGITFIPISKS